MYAQNGYLQPTTLFATFKIDDVCTIFPHEQTIEALTYFLNVHTSSDEKIRHGLTVDTIVRLVRLVLENQFFIYNNKLYRQTAGGASGSPSTMPLAYIYMFYRYQPLLTALLNNKNEIFGRY
jgi:hypothetical protein